MSNTALHRTSISGGAVIVRAPRLHPTCGGECAFIVFAGDGGALGGVGHVWREGAGDSGSNEHEQGERSRVQSVIACRAVHTGGRRD